MRQFLFLLLSLVFIVSCTNAQNPKTTDGQQPTVEDTIKQIRAIFEPFIKAENGYIMLAGEAETADDSRKNMQAALAQNRKLHEAIAKYATENKDNDLPVIAIALNLQSLDSRFIDSLLNTGEKYTKQPEVYYIRQAMKQMSSYNYLKGKQYKDVVLPDMNGKVRKLSSYIGKNKLVLLECWASWCPPCMNAQPLLRANYKAYHNKGFEIVAVSLDYMEEDWKATVAEQHLDWIHISDLKRWDSQVVKTYGINGIPFNLLIDAKGNILDVNISGIALAKRLAALK